MVRSVLSFDEKFSCNIETLNKLHKSFPRLKTEDKCQKRFLNILKAKLACIFFYLKESFPFLYQPNFLFSISDSQSPFSKFVFRTTAVVFRVKTKGP